MISKDRPKWARVSRHWYDSEGKVREAEISDKIKPLDAVLYLRYKWIRGSLGHEDFNYIISEITKDREGNND